jgi:hypothetical protein
MKKPQSKKEKKTKQFDEKKSLQKSKYPYYVIIITI